MSLSRLEVTSPSTVHLQTWGVDLRHPICVRSDAPASSGEAHFHTSHLLRMRVRRAVRLMRILAELTIDQGENLNSS